MMSIRSMKTRYGNRKHYHCCCCCCLQLQGIMYPGLQCTIAKWSPPQEKGKFVFATIGGTLGTVLTWPFVAYLMTELGWVYTFYIPATIVLAVTILWIITVYNSPIEHPRISEQELKFIEAAQGNSVSRIQVEFCIEFFFFLLKNYKVVIIFFSSNIYREDCHRFHAF